MFNRDQLIADLTGEEGNRLTVYDDAAPAAKVGPSYTLKGNPTVGVGHALNLTPFTVEQTKIILGWDIDAKTQPLYSALPWIANLTEARQRALADMAFNLGVAGLQAFHTFLSLMQAGNYAAAADDLKKTPWANQVGARAVHIENLIRNG